MRTVITYGTFDVFHEGHRRLLERAKALGDRLIVGVTSADYDRRRGKLNVVDSLPERMRSVEKTGLADLIVVEEYEGQKIRDVQQLGAHVFAIGSDWMGRFDYLQEWCDVVYLDRTPGVSSTMLRSDSHPMIKLGVIGTGRIAERMVVESRFISGVEVVSAYNPRLESASRFAQAHGLVSGHQEWGAFIDAVDAVYVASPHEHHVDYSRRALEAGRHVLCEKPAALSESELSGVQELADRGRLVYLEAIKTAFLPGFERMVGLVRSGAIGDIHAVHASFTKLVPPGGREWDLKSGGSMTELATYGALPIVKLLGSDVPAPHFSVVRRSGVDAFTSCRLDYEDAIGTFDVGIGAKTEGSLVIAGSTGFVRVPAPWWLTRTFEVHREDPNDTVSYAYPFAGDGLRYELSEFIKHINDPSAAPFALAPRESLAIARILEAFRRTYPSAGDRPGHAVEVAARQGEDASRLGVLGQHAYEVRS